MECKFNGAQIRELVGLAEDFVAKVLCPKIESYNNTENDAEFRAGICATLETAAASCGIGNTKYVKGKKRWYVDEVPEDDSPEEEEKAPDKDEAMADEISALIEKIVKAAKKHANGDISDYHATIASTALTLLQIGGKGSKVAAIVALDGILSGKVKFD